MIPGGRRALEGGQQGCERAPAETHQGMMALDREWCCSLLAWVKLIHTVTDTMHAGDEQDVAPLRQVETHPPKNTE